MSGLRLVWHCMTDGCKGQYTQDSVVLSLPICVLCGKTGWRSENFTNSNISDKLYTQAELDQRIAEAEESLFIELQSAVRNSLLKRDESDDLPAKAILSEAFQLCRRNGKALDQRIAQEREKWENSECDERQTRLNCEKEIERLRERIANLQAAVNGGDAPVNLHRNG